MLFYKTVRTSRILNLSSAGFKSSRPQTFSHISTQRYVKFKFVVTPSKLYRSVAQDPKNSEYFVPRVDYTLKQDVAKGNWMVTKLCEAGQILQAREFFDRMPDRDVISWTTLISGYIKCGMIKEARELFDRVDAIKNVVTWTAMLSGYVKAERIFEAERLFYDMPEKNVVAWNTMIDGYIRSDRTEKAMELFKRMEERNVVSWNTVLSGLVCVGRVEEARGLFNQMPLKNVISWTIMISGLARNGLVDGARLLFDGTPKRNVVTWNAMITGYAQNLRLTEAYGLFQMMPEKDAQSWNTMITGFIQNKELEMARMLFNKMPGKNVVSWTMMINGLMRDGKSEEALMMFSVMHRDNRVKPNEATFVSVLGACSDLAGLGEGMLVHQVISKTAYHEREFVIAALISMYSKCGELAMARQIFDDGLRGHGDLVSWNSMIAAYAHHGCGREAIKIFKEMQNIGLNPNDVTYVGLLCACSHAGLVQEGLDYFKLLLEDKAVKLREDHFTCLVDLYGRAGRLKEAFNLVEQLPMETSAYVWGPLLLGCNIHGNADIGKLVADRVLDVEPENLSPYLLLSNIYASSGKRKEAEMLKLKMKDRGLKKQPGCSWIEVGNKFHVFVVGDRSHRETEAIRSLLFNLHKKMKMVGYALLDSILIEDNFLKDFFII